MLAFALIGLAITAPSAPAPAEIRCGVIDPHGDGGVRMMPDLHILAQTAAPGAFAPGLAPGSDRMRARGFCPRRE